MSIPNSVSHNSLSAAVISFEQVQQAIARCLHAHPAIDAVLPKESFLLAELLGRMIYARSEAVDASALPPAMLADLLHWAAPAPLRAAA